LAKAQQRAGDLSAGRLVIVAAAVIGAGAFLGYGVVKMREGRDAKTVAGEAQPDATDLVTRAQKARRTLDTAVLVELEPRLATAPPEVTDARRERLAVLATLALESSVRGAVSGDANAKLQASHYVGRARPLVDQLEPELDPGFVLATRARLALANGDDVLARHPAVLLPGFRDRELQHVLLAEPLWHSDAGLTLDDAERTNLARALEATPEPTAFERLVLALALPGDRSRAQSLVGAVLEAAPTQPLAQVVLARLGSGATVAVAEPPPTELVEPVPTEPAPTEAEAVPTEPVPTEPAEPVEPPPSAPGTAKKANPTQPRAPKQPKTTPAQPKQPKATPADMTEQGCDLVRSGKAEQGFAMLQKAFDKDPRDTKVILCMVEGHMKLGRMESARAMVERVIRSSGKNKKALQLAAKIEDQLGNERSAADYYRKLLEVDPDNATATAYVEKHGG
jgi:TolA-binding protein